MLEYKAFGGRVSSRRYSKLFYNGGNCFSGKETTNI